MSTIFGITEDKMKETSSTFTLTENYQQPATWEKTCRQIEENTVDVGRNFATEARRIHEGLAPDRAIRGEARLDEARKLLEDGIPVAPLPFIPRSKAN